MCVCVCLAVPMSNVCKCALPRGCICLCMCMYVCARVCVCMCVCVCVCLSVRVCIYVCVLGATADSLSSPICCVVLPRPFAGSLKIPMPIVRARSCLCVYLLCILYVLRCCFDILS